YPDESECNKILNPTAENENTQEESTLVTSKSSSNKRAWLLGSNQLRLNKEKALDNIEDLTEKRTQWPEIVKITNDLFAKLEENKIKVNCLVTDLASEYEDKKKREATIELNSLDNELTESGSEDNHFVVALEDDSAAAFDAK
ncbi:7439_t:CDS:2, partial [Gigaspora margarita]